MSIRYITAHDATLLDFQIGMKEIMHPIHGDHPLQVLVPGLPWIRRMLRGLDS